MAQKDWNAGIIRPVPVAPAGPYQNGAAPGVWTLDQVAYWLKQGLWPIAGNIAPIGIFTGGGAVTTYINIATTGNSATFGNLTQSRRSLSGCGSTTRCLFGGGSDGSTIYNIIDYATFTTTGNFTDFGDLTQVQAATASFNSSTRGVFGGGYTNTEVSPTNTAVISYVTIASTGNATSFGSLTVARYAVSGCSSSTRGVFGGGFSTVRSNVIDYVTIASTGNATYFGDLTLARMWTGSCSSATRGLFGGGGISGGYSNVIDYVTIASTGNATDFGDLTSQRERVCGCSSSTRGIFGGGNGENVIDYVIIATTGNAVSFGQLADAGAYPAAASSSNGGTQ